MTYLTLVAFARLGALAAASVTLDVARQRELPDCPTVHLLQADFQPVHHILAAPLTRLLASATTTEHVKDVTHATPAATTAAHTLLDGILAILQMYTIPSVWTRGVRKKGTVQTGGQEKEA